MRGGISQWGVCCCLPCCSWLEGLREIIEVPSSLISLSEACLSLTVQIPESMSRLSDDIVHFLVGTRGWSLLRLEASNELIRVETSSKVKRGTGTTIFQRRPLSGPFGLTSINVIITHKSPVFRAWPDSWGADFASSLGISRGLALQRGLLRERILILILPRVSPWHVVRAQCCSWSWSTRNSGLISCNFACFQHFRQIQQLCFPFNFRKHVIEVYLRRYHQCLVSQFVPHFH